MAGGKHVPFRYITDLPKRAQVEIERDFAAVVAQITTAQASVFDCIIDAGLTVSLPAQHLYKNLTEAIAGETQYVANVDLSVGVYQRATVRIVEPAAVSIAGKGGLTLTSIAGGFTPDATTLGWDFRGVACTLGQQVNMFGLTIDPQAAGQGLVDQGFLNAHDCYFGANMTSPSGRNSQYWSCTFLGTLVMSSGGGVGVTHTFFDCQALAGFTTTSSLVGLLWYGGVINQGTVNISNGCTIYATVTANISITGGNADVRMFGSGGSFTMSGTGDLNAEISGVSSITLTNTGRKFVRATSNFSGGNCDITGPADVHVGHLLSNFGSHTILRGDGIVGTVVSAGAGGRLECIGMRNSQVRFGIADNTAASISLDASSHNNIIIWSGRNAVSAGAYTNSGTANRLITEDLDTLLTSAFITSSLGGAASAGTPGIAGEDGLDGMPGPPGPAAPYSNYTPVVTQGATPTQSVTDARFVKNGARVCGRAVVTIGVAGTTGTAANAVLIDIPVTAAASINANAVIGAGWIFDSSANLTYYGVIVLNSTTKAQFLRQVEGVAPNFLGVAGFTAALAQSDTVALYFDYEAA